MDTARENRLAALYTEAWKTRLKAFVGRKYHNFGDWEGWFEEAHQNLALKIDRMPVGNDISDAMIFAVFKNELISVKRNRLGYPRPRQWLREFSALGQDLFEWMCLQRMNKTQIINRALEKSRQASYATGDEPASFKPLVEKLIDTMIEKKECDGVKPETEQIDGESVLQIATEEPSTEQQADQEQLKLVLSLLLGATEVTDNLKQKAAEKLSSIRQALNESALLEDLDILVLRCYYFQGLSQNDIAKLTKLPLQKVVRRREAAIGRIREFLEKQGLDRESLL